MTQADRGEDGKFLPGNQFWKQRSSHGANPKFSDPKELWSACAEYFEWVENNPLWEDRLVTFQGTASHEPAAKMRAMTIGGLCIFLDISQETWNQYRKNSDLSEITTRVDQIIRTQKFEGASADLLNANIIARDLGLSDKQELTGKDGKDLVAVEPRQLARAILATLSSAKLTEPEETEN